MVAGGVAIAGDLNIAYGPGGMFLLRNQTQLAEH